MSNIIDIVINLVCIVIMTFLIANYVGWGILKFLEKLKERWINMKINWLNLISAYVLLVIVFKDSATIVLDVFSLVVAALLVFTGVKKKKGEQ